MEALLSPVLEELAYELVDLEFVKEGQSWYLRLYLDKEGGITLDDCEKASRAIEVVMDEKDPIEQAYYLEVSSPGLDRPLKKEKDFIKYAGEVVDVKLYRAQNKKKNLPRRTGGAQRRCGDHFGRSGRTSLFCAQRHCTNSFGDFVLNIPEEGKEEINHGQSRIY